MFAQNFLHMQPYTTQAVEALGKHYIWYVYLYFHIICGQDNVCLLNLMIIPSRTVSWEFYNPVLKIKFCFKSCHGDKL